MKSINTSVIFYGHLKRCVKTASILAKGIYGAGTIQIDGLHEAYRGDWSQLKPEVKKAI